MNYPLLRSILFSISPELSHSFSLKAIKVLKQFNLLASICPMPPAVPKKLWGLTFENPVGLAAGLDKNGDYIDSLGALGFGFIEIGTVTPRPQSGNLRPRLFRLPENDAIINRMGFNNKGVDHLVNQVKKKKYRKILGINIGKNASTSIENAIEDYQFCLKKVYNYAHYVTINISSPNTPGLRSLQSSDYLNGLLAALKQTQEQLANNYNKYVPLVVKIAPDISEQELTEMAAAFCEHNIDGIIATNTTLTRGVIQSHPLAGQTGGLSGTPLFEQATAILTSLKKQLKGKEIPIIASGGIMSGEQAKKKFAAGADLIQLYTGLIYSGPQLISQCCTTDLKYHEAHDR